MQLFFHSSVANCRWTESEWEFSISDSGFQCTITRDSNRKMPSALNLGFYRQRHIWEVSWSHRRANVLKKMKFGKNVIYYVNLLANIQQTHGKHLRNHKSWLELLFVTIDKLFLPSPLQWSLFADFKLTQTNNRLVSVTRVLLTSSDQLDDFSLNWALKFGRDLNSTLYSAQMFGNISFSPRNVVCRFKADSDK